MTKVAHAVDAPSVAIGMVYENEMPTSFVHSWTNLLFFDVANWGLLSTGPGLLSVRAGTDGLVAARNTVVENFLATDGEWLLWIDSDMGFSPDTVYRLFASADKTDRPIVGGLCFASREYADDGMGGYLTRPAPTIFQLDDSTGRVLPAAGKIYPVSSLVKVAATGSAFIIIHRSVFEAIGSGWYDRIQVETGVMGEDVSFCVRARAHDFPIHVYTGARTSHFKPQWVQESDYWRAVVAPPAVDETAVIVPVLGRPASAEPFMATLRASTGLATVYAVADDNDPETAEAWAAAGAEVIVGDAVTFAKKVNLAFGKTRQPWVFLTGDDVRFRAGWLDHAQHIAKTFDGLVVGTNDLGNPRVLTGDHATHLLIARDYVDEVGASWDGPGVVCHEGYRHWFVDDEIVTAAKQRGVWQMALGSIVEHLHPRWGKAEGDDVYRLGESASKADEDLYAARLAAHS